MLTAPRKLKDVIQQWGGGTSAFFGYTHFSHDLSTALLMPMLPLIKEGLGLSYLQAGLLLSAFSVTSGIAQLPGGWIGDRFTKQIAVAIGLGGVGVTAVAVGLSPSYYPMLAILVIMGILAGAYHPSATSLLSNYFEEQRRGKVIGLHMVGGSVGQALGPILGGLVAAFLGWRFAFIILGIPALVAVPLVMKFRQSGRMNAEEPVRGVPTGGSAPGKQAPRLSRLGQVLRPVAIITTLAILTQLIAGAVMAFISVYLADKYLIAPAIAAMWLGVVRGGGMAGSLFGGWLSDKWGRMNTIFLALVATGPVLYLLTTLPFNAALVVVFILFGLLMQLRQASIQPLLMDKTPPDLRGTVFGIYFGLSMEGQSVAQPVAGHFMDIFGIIDVFNSIALITCALSLVALILAIRYRLRQRDIL